MNIFKQYGIKEIADVVFYSIIRVGTEEFYIPVLYLDTLKTAQLNKNVETVTNYGGKGNGKILAWNFVEDVQLSFEDALFSQMSLDTYMNGRVMAKMSDWSSSIAKLSVANKYGQKNYSIKAYPSPQLTPSEWEIVFRCAQKAGYDPRIGDNWSDENKDNASHNWKYLYNSEGQDEDVDKIVAENRWKLVDNYYHRTQPTPKNQDLSMYFDYNEDKYESLSIIIKHWDKADELNFAQKVYNMEIGDKIGGWIDLQISYRSKIGPSGYEFDSYKWTLLQDNVTEVEDKKIIVRLHFCIQKQLEGHRCLWAYISADSESTQKGTAVELPKIFTAKKIIKMKEDHENWVLDNLSEKISNITYAELDVICKAIASSPSHYNCDSDYSTISIEQKIEKNGLSDNIYNLIMIGMLKTKYVYDYLNNQFSPTFSENLIKCIKCIYLEEAQKNTGDDLFLAVLERMNAGIEQGITKQAAGIAVLTYFFHICEVFEK